MQHRLLSPILAVGLACAAAPGLAEIGLTLEFDGATHVFSVQTNEARAGFSRFHSVDAISIEGTDGRSRLVLELSLPPGSRSGDTPHDARISFRPDGWRDYWVSPLEFPRGAVVIEQLDLSGSAQHIAGHFAVPLCLTPTLLHSPDPARCVPAAGHFATPLVPD